VKGWSGAAVAITLAAVLPLGARAQNGAESPDRIRATAQSYVRTQLSRATGEVHVQADPVDARLRLARCAQPLVAQVPASAQLQGRVAVAVSCPGPVRWSVYVPVSIEARIPVLVLRRAVARDTKLTAQDVMVQTRRVAGLGGAYLTDPADLASRTLERSLAAGTTLVADMFKPDVVVRQGQEVTLVAGNGGVEVRASGRALTDASAGARIRVQNLSSLRVVEGIAESAGIVRVQ